MLCQTLEIKLFIYLFAYNATAANPLGPQPGFQWDEILICGTIRPLHKQILQRGNQWDGFYTTTPLLVLGGNSTEIWYTHLATDILYNVLP